ncbi:MAG TPA: VOC family protein [Pseudonocardiaceae bacterium]|jgi:PhnB protein
MGQITPYLLYEDAAAALDWLSSAFGFKETLRFTDDNGRVTHAEMDAGAGGQFMLGEPGAGYHNPLHTRHHHSFLHVLVDDVDAHFERARAAGAGIVAELGDKEYGTRSYQAADLEGHRWDFATQIREVEPEEWGATRSAT